jgi:hypothetical protein
MSETELVDRLERLERAHRRVKGFALASLVLATALATIYAMQPVPQKITANEFDVLDGSGRVRVRMGMLSGKPDITLLNAQGNTRAEIFVDPSFGPAIILSDAQGKERAELSLGPSDKPRILFTDAQGKIRAGMFVDSSGVPSIGLSDSIVMLGNDEKHLVILRAPSAVSQSAAEPGKRPRVFIEAWGVPNTATSSVGQIDKGPVPVTDPTQEMATFALRCPQAIPTIERQKADYVLRLDESLIAPDDFSYLFPDLAKGRPTYRSLVFDAEGSQIGTGAALSSLDDSLEGACRTIMNSAAPSQ